MLNKLKLITALFTAVLLSSCGKADPEKELYKKAMSGDERAKVNLGLLYMTQYERNRYSRDSKLSEKQLDDLRAKGYQILRESLPYLEQHAQQNTPRTHGVLSDMYGQGWGVLRDEVKSLEYAKVAAEEGSYMHQAKVAIDCYLDFNSRHSRSVQFGIHSELERKQLEQSFNCAQKWFYEYLGHDDEKVNEMRPLIREMVGNMYYSRESWYLALKEFNQSYPKCFSCTEKLAEMYYKGLGVKQDFKKAKELFGEACDKGKQDSCAKYAELNTSGI